MKTEKYLLHIGAIKVIAFVCMKELNNSPKSAVYIDDFILYQLYIYRILTPKMAAAFGKGGKYYKNQELSDM
jgi:uncharacterized membrane protein